MTLYDKLTSPFVIDGVEYPNVRAMSLTRNFSILDGSNAGRTMSGDMMRDIIGTYYNYTIKFRSKVGYEQEYENLFDVLSSPVDFHELKLPFGNKTIIQKMYVTSGSDNLKRFKKDGINRFYEMSINFVAKGAYRVYGES